MFVLLLLFCGCVHRGIPLPGSTKFVGKDIRMHWQEYTVLEEEKLQKPPQKKTKTIEPTTAIQQKIVQAARSLLGAKSLYVQEQSFRYDCSGFVAAVYAKAGIAMNKGGSDFLLAASHKYNVYSAESIANIGDVVFFDNTYDRNKNGKRDDGVTHVGIVETIDATGLISIIHLGHTGIVRIYMNLLDANSHTGPDGQLWNSYVRVNKKNDTGPNLTGQLWSGFASFWKLPPNTF